MLLVSNADTRTVRKGVKEQIESWRERKVELAEIQDQLPPEATPVIIQYIYDVKYIMYLLEQNEKLQNEIDRLSAVIFYAENNNETKSKSFP